MSQNPVALVTGGAKRVGREICLHLATSGYDIALHYNRSKEAAKNTAAEIAELGVECRLFQANLAQADEFMPLVPKVHPSFGWLDCLINSASTFPRKPFLESDPDFFDMHFTVNFKAPFFLIQQFAKTAESGLVINMLDVDMYTDVSNYAVYLLAKKSMRELTRMTARELAPHIRINGIAPGHIMSPSNKDKEFQNRMLEKTALKMSGKPSYITQAISYIIENEFVTGDVLVVDGGYRVNL